MPPLIHVLLLPPARSFNPNALSMIIYLQHADTHNYYVVYCLFVFTCRIINLVESETLANFSLIIEPVNGVSSVECTSDQLNVSDIFFGEVSELKNLTLGKYVQHVYVQLISCSGPLLDLASCQWQVEWLNNGSGSKVIKLQCMW